MNANDRDKLDFEVQAESDELVGGGRNWVALGFSRDAAMGDDTVLMFNSNTGEVEVYWNEATDTHFSSPADPDSPGVEANYVAYTSDEPLVLYGSATRDAVLEFILPPTSDQPG